MAQLRPASAKALLRRMFDAAIASAQPALCIPPHLPQAPRGRSIVIGAGKASAAMAQAVERNWRGVVMDSYTLEKLTGWTPELSPPPDSPLYRWRVLAGEVHPPWRVAWAK